MRKRIEKMKKIETIKVYRDKIQIKQSYSQRQNINKKIFII